jgi:hypothetical protein
MSLWRSTAIQQPKPNTFKLYFFQWYCGWAVRTAVGTVLVYYWIHSAIYTGRLLTVQVEGCTPCGAVRHPAGTSWVQGCSHALHGAPHSCYIPLGSRKAQTRYWRGAMWNPCISHATTQSHWPSSPPFASRLRGQQFASRGCTHNSGAGNRLMLGLDYWYIYFLWALQESYLLYLFAIRNGTYNT